MNTNPQLNSKVKEMTRHLLIALPLLLAFQVSARAETQNSCDEFQRLVKATYNFKPSSLTATEQTAKSEAMDRFWEAAKKNTPETLPCLRQSLADPNADAWFRFDGSNLLVSLDPSRDSKLTLIRNYTAANLDDVNLRAWVSTLAALGAEGFDVSEAATRWLSYPKANYYVPEHAYEVKTFDGALYLFGSMDEAQATPALIKIVNQPNHPGREHALKILTAQATPEALRALKQIDASTLSPKAASSLHSFLAKPKTFEPRAKPKTSREEFLKSFEKLLNNDSSDFMGLVEKVPDGERDVVAVLKPEDLPLVRRVRRHIIAAGNQHAAEFYDSFTDILMTLVWKPELTR
jgi:hypothetical protein